VRVAAAAIAKKWLSENTCDDTRLSGAIGAMEIPFKQWKAVNQNPFFAADASLVPRLEEFMTSCAKSGDSVVQNQRGGGRRAGRLG